MIDQSPFVIDQGAFIESFTELVGLVGDGAPEMLVRVHTDGRVQYGPNYDADEAWRSALGFSQRPRALTRS